MADPDDRGHVVRDAWNAAVDELRPDASPTWNTRWADLSPDDPADAFQIEADRRIYDAVAVVEHAKSDRAEFLCERCRTIHPPQPDCKIAHPCPVCGLYMVPTSPARRKIELLEAELARARTELADARNGDAFLAVDLRAAETGFSMLTGAVERLGAHPAARRIMSEVSTYETDWWGSHAF